MTFLAGTGICGEVLEQMGQSWIGCDISSHMLNACSDSDKAKSVQCDVGDGIPFRDKIFDGCVSVSTIQWLCYYYPKTHDVLTRDFVEEKITERIVRFFKALIRVLKPDARCVFQYFPENFSQMHRLKRCAKSAGFPIVFSRADKLHGQKYYLFLSLKSDVREKSSQNHIYVF